MKKLFSAFAIIFACSANAQEIFATTANNAGGKIVLLMLPEACQKGQSGMFATDSTGYSIVGCWKMVGSYVSVRFSNGSTRMYDGDIFTLSDFYQKKFEPVKYH